MVGYIYYTGIGAKKNGKHTVKEFLDIMNKNFNIECSESLPKLDYKSCSGYKRSRKNGKKIINKCNQYKKTAKKRKCNLDEYIKFSGAEEITSGV